MGNSDDSFTRFPNDIFDAVLQYRFSAVQLTAVLYVVRQVNGWGKPSDRISVSRMAKETGFTRRAMIGAVSDLEKMGVLSVERNGSGRLSEMSVKSPLEWDKPVNASSHVNVCSLGTVVHRGVNASSQVGVNASSQEPVNVRSHTKERKKEKETIPKKGPSAPISQEEDDDLNNTMFDGKITVREWRMLSEAEQVAMYEAEGYT